MDASSAVASRPTENATPTLGDDVSTPARSLPGLRSLRGSHLPGASLRADEFDALMTDLVPKVRQLLPLLSDIEVLRAAARMAEYRLEDERTLMGIDFHGRP